MPINLGEQFPTSARAVGLFPSLHLGDFRMILLGVVFVNVTVSRTRCGIDRTLSLLETAGWYFRCI